MDALLASGLTKSFLVEEKRIDVLRGIDLRVPAGAFHAVMGRGRSPWQGSR